MQTWFLKGLQSCGGLTEVPMEHEGGAASLVRGGIRSSGAIEV